MKNHSVYLKVKDHSVSGEAFELLHDAEYDMLLTIPKPSESDLARYYESEDYISHTDQKRNFFEQIYHVVRNVALKSKISIINQGRQKGTLLDIGAGTGDFLVAASQDGWSVKGIEPSDNARSLAESKGVIFVGSTAVFPDESIDVITMWHVLEHVPDVHTQIAELKRILKPGGKIVIAVPNFKSYDAQFYGAFWAAYDVPRHLSHFSKKSIRTLFAAYNLQVVKHLPMLFDAFYVSLLSEKYKHGRMNYLKAIYVGLKSNLKAAASGEYSSIIYILQHQE